ncbi:hypothetical protein O6H91_10G053700 [Diphasiastrum complanatum]|uniref:Uncharacterized protein n=1 Tax=Diphasiastrum complanatum TaxID=34168 RepID=A0ACC2CHA1_DIPCM|nr:hypothetical protein O6H91_Y553900 [Diphasiastrum complanatum]KAJ7541312.1 hypothetical protein O6H91_10G053700 [Diphasiastrum complanatum]
MAAVGAARGAPAASEVLNLFRSFLKETRKFADYNIREYIKRRTGESFRESRDLDAAAAASAFEFGKKQLEVVRRQSVVYSLYAPRVKNIMELKFQES